MIESRDATYVNVTVGPTTYRCAAYKERDGWWAQVVDEPCVYATGVTLEDLRENLADTIDQLPRPEPFHDGGTFGTGQRDVQLHDGERIIPAG